LAGVGDGGRRDPPDGAWEGVAPAKIAIPRLSLGYVSRPRLLARLDAAAERQQVVLVVGPAGYGKTTMLAEWVESGRDRTAWVRVDDDDNDEHRFWSAVLAALCSCRAVPQDAGVRGLAVPDAAGRMPGFLAAAVETLGVLPTPIRLVLDDMHELTSAETMHGLGALIRDRPARLQIVLSSRVDPPLAVGRLRLAGELCEVRARELEFQVDEATALFARAAVPVTAAQVRSSVEQTGGWAAGLRLAALSMRELDDIDDDIDDIDEDIDDDINLGDNLGDNLGNNVGNDLENDRGHEVDNDVDNKDALLTDLAGNQRAISDYLQAEIVSRLSGPAREVLQAVSVCDRPLAGLAVAVSGRIDAGDVLAGLERDTSLVVSCGEGRRWFRVHPLLRAHLVAELRRRRPDRLALLHTRAARWYASVADAASAIRHARMAGDPVLLGELLRGHGAALVMSGGHGLAREALSALRSEEVEGDSRLALVAALAHLDVANLATVDHYLRRAEVAWPEQPSSELVALNALARTQRGWYGGGWVARVTELVEPMGEPGMDLMGLIPRTNAALAAGHVDEAARLARLALDSARLTGNVYQQARCMLLQSVAAALRGDFRSMVTLAERAGTLAPEEAWRGTVADAGAVLLQAYGALLRARPEECLRLLSLIEGPDGSQAGEVDSGVSRIMPMLWIMRGGAQFDMGEHGPGLEALRAGRLGMTRGLILDRANAALTALVEHPAAVRVGMMSRARAVLSWAEDWLGPTGDTLLLRAYAPARMSRYAAARRHLRPLLDESVPALVAWTRVEGWLLQCWIELRSGNRPRARDALRRALMLSQDMGVLRPLAGSPPELAELLTQQLGGLGQLEPLAREVLTLRPGVADRLTVSAMTARERAVLGQLCTVRSLGEIATDLTVSVNTVKTHVRAIYAKLGVTSRRDAVAAAHHHGLLGLGVVELSDLNAIRGGGSASR
jgi:LuxR family transcriptional regulator, maltose regulon positive regulatory protein